MKIIDLTKKIYSNMEVYPGDPETTIEKIHSIETHGWNLSRIVMGSHTGTHVDAYSHMFNDKSSISDLPLNLFIGDAILVKATDYLPAGINLIFDGEVDIDLLDKIIEAKPNFVGGNLTIELEKALLASNIVTYTDLINLDMLPRNEKFFFIGLPLFLENCDGSPVRAVAIIEK